MSASNDCMLVTFFVSAPPEKKRCSLKSSMYDRWSGQLVDSLEGDLWFWGVACGGNGYSGSG